MIVALTISAREQRTREEPSSNRTSPPQKQGKLSPPYWGSDPHQHPKVGCLRYNPVVGGGWICVEEKSSSWLFSQLGATGKKPFLSRWITATADRGSLLCCGFDVIAKEIMFSIQFLLRFVRRQFGYSRSGTLQRRSAGLVPVCTCRWKIVRPWVRFGVAVWLGVSGGRCWFGSDSKVLHWSMGKCCSLFIDLEWAVESDGWIIQQQKVSHDGNVLLGVRQCAPNNNNSSLRRGYVTWLHWSTHGLVNVLLMFGCSVVSLWIQQETDYAFLHRKKHGTLTETKSAIISGLKDAKIKL